MTDLSITTNTEGLRTAAFVQSLVDAATGMADLARQRALSANPMRAFGFDPIVVSAPE